MPQFKAPQDVTELRALAVDIVESFKSDLDGRFSDENVELWQALQVLSPDHSQNDFLDFTLLILLIEYCHSIPFFRDSMGIWKMPRNHSGVSVGFLGSCL